jgi:hypothetical protein
LDRFEIYIPLAPHYQLEVRLKNSKNILYYDELKLSDFMAIRYTNKPFLEEMLAPKYSFLSVHELTCE